MILKFFLVIFFFTEKHFIELKLIRLGLFCNLMFQINRFYIGPRNISKKKNDKR